MYNIKLYLFLIIKTGSNTIIYYTFISITFFCHLKINIIIKTFKFSILYFKRNEEIMKICWEDDLLMCKLLVTHLKCLIIGM